VLQEDKSLVKVGIEGRKVVQEALLLAELRDEETSKRDIHKDALVHCLAEDPANETILVKAMVCVRWHTSEYSDIARSSYWPTTSLDRCRTALYRGM